MTKSDESATFFFDILKYAYPVLIKYLWTKDFETLMATPLARADSDDIYRCRVFLCSCRIVGQTEYILDMEKCGYVSVCSKNGICVIKCLQNNCWIEYFDSRWADFYENLLFSLMQNDKRITALQERWPIIKEEMRPLCFVWLKEFIGYNSTMNIESYFNDVAYYDAIHSTEWDYFPEQSKFNRVAYGNFTDTIIDLSGYAAKHIRFTELLQSSHPELLAENLFYNIRMEDETLRLIRENRECSEQDAYTILSCISLSSDNSELYNYGQVNCAPLIKISRNQYLHSVAGSLFHPFSFLLSSLQQRFLNDFSRNINSRETIFRKQLYEIVGNSFTCINHNIVIKHGGKVVTDIDAAMVDKISGEIALFQLKWQNQTVDSIRSLHSKAQNYVTHRLADRAGLTCQHIFDLGICEGQPGFAPHLLPNVIHAANHAEFKAVCRIGHGDSVVDAHEVHRPAAQVHEEHGRFVLQKPHFGHKGGVALREDSNFLDGNAVLHALEFEIHGLVAPQQILFELGFVASETRQRQPRRNPHRTFGRQAALQDFFCNRCQRQQVVVVVYGFVPLDRLPPGATNKKAPAKL